MFYEKAGVMDGKCGLREGSKRLGKDGSKGIINILQSLE